MKNEITSLNTLAERDKELEKLWAELEDVPMNPDTECIETAFHVWPAGTEREDIWLWFDKRHSKGIAYLLYGTPAQCTPEEIEAIRRHNLCEECMSEICAFVGEDGLCKLPFIKGRKAESDDEGCKDCLCKEDSEK